MAGTLLILLGGIIGIGFVADLLFEKTRIPTVLFLIAIGMLLGPVLQIIPPSEVSPFMPAFGAIALTIILFEGGLDLKLRHTIRQAGRSFLLAVLSFVISILFIYYALVLGMNIEGRNTWIVAAALACTSAPIVIPIITRVIPNSPMRPLLTFESAISDALAVITVLLLLGLGTMPFSGSTFAGQFGRSFLIGTTVAVAGGFSWLWLFRYLANHRFFYLMTVGFVFLMMGLVESIHGSGAIAVLLFGLVLANGDTLYGLFSERIRDQITKRLGEQSFYLHPRITQAHAEVSFLIRSFFFVYLGIIFRWPGSNFRIWLGILLVMVAVIFGREIAVQVTGWTTRISGQNRTLLSAMLPRGLATAVLTSLLVSQTGSGALEWEVIATFVIVLSNIWMTFRLFKIPLTREGEEPE